MQIYTLQIKTPLGQMIACSTEDAICLLEFFDKPAIYNKTTKQIAKILNAEIADNENKLLLDLKMQLNEYFEGNRKDFDLPIFFVGTDFQKKAWDALTTIPYGQTRSYKQQAALINNPKAVRAIGNANNKNKISIVVPCHRVIGSNGKLVGYGGELWRKEWLLKFEKEGKFI
jgi:O-6-methylguanine DNA methyltransferase